MASINDMNDLIAEDRRTTVPSAQLEMLEHLAKHLAVLDTRVMEAVDEETREFWTGFATAVGAIRIWEQGHSAFLKASARG